MPITTNEMAGILEKHIGSKKLIDSVNESYNSLNDEFNDKWREEIFEMMS